jgi:hypothetical protein
MREHLIRVAAPTAFVVVELEAPTRIFACGSRPERLRVAQWIAERPTVAHALGLLALDGIADPEREAAWSRQLAAEEGGITAAVVELLLRADAGRDVTTTGQRPPPR